MPLTRGPASPRMRSLADAHDARPMLPRQASSATSSSSASAFTASASASASTSTSVSSNTASSSSLSSASSSSSSYSPSASSSLGSNGDAMSSPASANLNSTRIVLGRGFSNGQLTYTVPISAANQQVNAQLDTGSGDLWLANQDCDSDSCKGHQGLTVTKFNDRLDTVVDQDTPFNISYLLGSASGQVKTTSMLFGDPITSRLIINSQAFGSCSQVANEDMDSGDFSGIIGLGPPANSLIQADLNATSNTASLNVNVRPPQTGAVLAGFWNGARPGRRFMGIGMQRLEEDGGKGDSVLTIGNHDPAYAGSTNPSINYTSAIGDADGVVRHWRLPLTEITVQLQHGVTEPIPFGTSSVIAGSNPIAVFASGASVNLGPESTLNALYGAWGIGPASDGGYYVPCNLQLNITLGLGGTSIPIHPLDASLELGSGNGPSGDGTMCLGSFQALRSLSGSSNGANLNASFLPADFVLSPAFMRSAYTVFSCDNGLNTTQAQAAGMTVTSPCEASIGLRPLVNMTAATQQFTAVRIKKQTLGQSGAHGSPGGSGSGNSKGLSEGIKVVIGCVCAIVVISVLFGVALWRLRRRRRRIAAARAALLAAQAEKSGGGAGVGTASSGTHHGHSKKQSNPYSVMKIDGVNVPMELLGKDDDSSSQVALSPAQRAKARQLHHIHGVFDDDMHDDELGRGEDPRWGEEVAVNPTNLHAAGLVSWDVSSTGYVDARQVKNAYLASLTAEERKAFLDASAKRQAQSDSTRSVPQQPESNVAQHTQTQSQHDAQQQQQYPNRDSTRTASDAPLLQHDELR
ncbi:Endopeptidase [Pseudozyma hubeiensis]|nr:Endopeptidase [Pseudozyma hubeiensis]